MAEGRMFLDDEPIEREEQDVLRQWGYVAALRQAVLRSPPTFCIGLFGGWGSGKTSILRAAARDLTEAGRGRVRCVVYDAWRYAGDSLRRSLLQCARGQLGLGDGEQDLYVSRAEEGTVKTALRRTVGLAVVFCLAAAALGALGGYAQFLLREPGAPTARLLALASLAWAGVPALLWGLFSIVLAPALQRRLVVTTPPPFSTEQFEDRFHSLLEDRRLGRVGRVAFFIDNVDRCEPERALEILGAITTFLEHEKCVYVVACDDQALTKHLARRYAEGALEAVTGPPPESQADGGREAPKPGAPAYDRTWGQELANSYLHKLFQVELRIARPRLQDLIVLSRRVGEEAREVLQGLPTEVVDQAVTFLARSPRAVKRFLNRFAAARQLAEAQQGAGRPYLTGVTDNLPFLACVLLIEELWPRLYEEAAENPEALAVAFSAARGEDFAARYPRIMEIVRGDPRLRRLLDWAYRYRPRAAGKFLHLRDDDLEESLSLIGYEDLVLAVQSGDPDGRFGHAIRDAQDPDAVRHLRAVALGAARTAREGQASCADVLRALLPVYQQLRVEDDRELAPAMCGLTNEVEDDVLRSLPAGDLLGMAAEAGVGDRHGVTTRLVHAAVRSTPVNWRAELLVALVRYAHKLAAPAREDLQQAAAAAEDPLAVAETIARREVGRDAAEAVASDGLLSAVLRAGDPKQGSLPRTRTALACVAKAMGTGGPEVQELWLEWIAWMLGTLEPPATNRERAECARDALGAALRRPPNKGLRGWSRVEAALATRLRADADRSTLRAMVLLASEILHLLPDDPHEPLQTAMQEAVAKTSASDIDWIIGEAKAAGLEPAAHLFVARALCEGAPGAGQGHQAAPALLDFADADPAHRLMRRLAEEGGPRLAAAVGLVPAFADKVGKSSLPPEGKRDLLHHVFGPLLEETQAHPASEWPEGLVQAVLALGGGHTQTAARAAEALASLLARPPDAETRAAVAGALTDLRAELDPQDRADVAHKAVAALRGEEDSPEDAGPIADVLYSYRADLRRGDEQQVQATLDYVRGRGEAGRRLAQRLEQGPAREPPLGPASDPEPR